jgi:hypothetical protein
MIKSLYQYVSEEVLTRARDIVFGADFWGAALIGFVLGRWGSTIIPESTSVSSIGVALLTYSAIALGFCLAGLTLVLTLPNEGFMRRLGTSRPPKKKHDAYSDLLFIFSWTAIVHWIILVVSLALLVLAGSQASAFQPGRHRLSSGLVAGVSCYGLFEFLLTLITLSQLGKSHIRSLLQTKKE